MNDLKKFVNGIDGFYSLSAAQQIKYFAFYILFEKNQSNLTARDIKQCFDELHLNSYSNITQYLNSHSLKKANQEFIRIKDGFALLATLKHEIETELNIPIELSPSDSLYPLSIFEKSPSYLQAFATEATSCYDYTLYNSCLFMIRKICETLLIELFESKEIESKIKTPNGDYFQLSELIKAAVTESSWKLSKIVKENLPKIKLLADSSVHSKRFKARKADIDPMKTDVRIAFEELLTLIDYPIKKANKK